MAAQDLATRILILLILKLIWPLKPRAIKEFQTQKDMFQYRRLVSGANCAGQVLRQCQMALHFFL